MRLTPRETEVARLVTRGIENREIAALLGISIGMTKEHLRNIFIKNDIHSRTRLAVVFLNTEALNLLREVHGKLTSDTARLYEKIGIRDEWFERCESVINLGNGE